jgi:hypothetical protein
MGLYSCPPGRDEQGAKSSETSWGERGEWLGGSEERCESSHMRSWGELPQLSSLPPTHLPEELLAPPQQECGSPHTRAPASAITPMYTHTLSPTRGHSRRQACANSPERTRANADGLHTRAGSSSGKLFLGALLGGIFGLFVRGSMTIETPQQNAVRIRN